MKIVCGYRACQLLVLLGLLAASPDLLRAAKQPHVIVILTDDQGWGDLSLNGN